MRAYLISDNHDTIVGMRLAGIEGEIVLGRDDAAAAAERALEMKDLALLVITEKAASLIPEIIQSQRERGDLPILVEIPDRHGSRRGADFLTRYVREAIGVKME